MTILAIDPGNEQSAFVVWDGKLHNFGKVANEDLLSRIHGGYKTADRCVIEMIGHYGTGMPAGKDVFDTCVWIGRFTEAYGADRVERILRPTVKANLCGSAKAKDPNVRQAIIDRFGGKEKAIGKKAAPGPLYGVAADVWAALAVALTWWDQHRCGMR